MTLCARVISLFLITFVMGGCYTQVRSPMERAEAQSRVENPSDVVSVQRFEYYHHYGRNELRDPYNFRTLQAYQPYEPYLQWPYYTRTPTWHRYQLAWDQACWNSVYHPQWRRYPPRVLIPYVVYGSSVVSRDRDNEPEVVVRRRPQVRQGGFEGASPSAQAIRTNSVNTPSVRERPPSSGTSSKQTTEKKEEKKKEETKEEKREEKRAEGKKRGGMR